MSRFVPSCLPWIVAALTAASVQADEVVRVPDLAVVDTRPSPLTNGASAAKLDLASVGLAWDDVIATAPGLHFNDSGTGTFGAPFSVRGLSSTPYFGDSALTLYVGDIPLSGPAASPALLPGLSSASVLRGPQASFSFGRATTGGVAVLQLAEATTGQGRLLVATGNRGLRSAEATQHVAAGSLGASVSLGWSQRDGVVRNLTLGQTVGDQDHRGANVALRWQASSKLRFSIHWLGSQARDGAQPLAPIDGPFDTVERPTEGRADSDFNGVSLRSDAETNAGTFSAITSYTRWTLQPYENTLVLPPPFNSRLTQEQTSFNQELRATSARGARLPWTAGAFWSEGRTDGDVLRSIMGVIPIEGSSYRLEQKTAAAYGQVMLLEDEGWTLDGALRVERQRRTFHRDETVPAQATFSASSGRNRYAPRLNIAKRLGAGERLSASWSEAYKPGGYSAFTSRADLAPFSAERTRAWEAAYEGRLNARWPFTVRAYRYEIRNYQVERSFTQTDYLVVNAKGARSEGVEIESGVDLLKSWRMDGSAGWNRARLRAFTDPFSGQTFDGNPLPFTPSMTAQLSSTVILGHGFALDGAVRWTGRTYFTEGGDERYSQSGYSTLGGALRYEYRAWSLALRGANLGGTRYRTLLVPGVDHAVPGAPRQWSVEAGYRW